jgi:hypothetical protein
MGAEAFSLSLKAARAVDLGVGGAVVAPAGEDDPSLSEPELAVGSVSSRCIIVGPLRGCAKRIADVQRSR